MEQYANRLGASYARHWDHSQNMSKSVHDFAEISALQPFLDRNEKMKDTHSGIQGLYLCRFEAGQMDIRVFGGDPFEGDADAGFHYEAHVALTVKPEEREMLNGEDEGWICLPVNYPCTSTLGGA